MSDPALYTIGWICAISTEYTAARQFLDAEHEPPKHTSEHDNNAYTLGRVGKHNVVIAVLPDAEYGIGSAATVSRDMLHSFPNVRIGLMVGIGGGAPSLKHDIRLGDVVVSSPSGGHGGVFQYDFGKTIQAQEFRQTGNLNQPPAILRSIVTRIRSYHEDNGNKFDDAIDAILSRKPRLRKKYGRPEDGTDQLYKASYVHRSEDGLCEETCGSDASNRVQRHRRSDEDDNPAIHYGLIASANQVMKDATIRDALIKEKGVLCFEMEAAGLMNHFPCLVIRGICDYADSHKNKQWQGYAAMAAAAYGKEVLKTLAPSRVEYEKKIAETLKHS
jgi:nucleoside phosphorylase